MTEVDRWGEERNRQPEFFFNGIVSHVRSEDGGYINSWDQATRLANYWRRFYNIPEVHENTSWNSSWHNYQQPSDNADRTSEVHEVPLESDMEDSASIAANLGTLPIPSQIHQLATIQPQGTYKSSSTPRDSVAQNGLAAAGRVCVCETSEEM